MNDPLIWAVTICGSALAWFLLEMQKTI